LGGYVEGSGSAGQVAYWSSASAITGESNLFWDATNDRLGIGGLNTSYKLQITNSAALGITISTVGSDSGNPHIQMLNGAIDTTIAATSNGLELTAYSSHALLLKTANVERFRITTNGRVLIGTPPPSESTFQLDVSGTGRFSSDLTANSFIKIGGTSSQFLKADGSVDSTTYVPVGRTITINGTTQDLSADRTFNVGTVTSVTASSPLFSSGGTTPNITIQQASGSQNGFLSSTDWTTFNNKQNALTNPVTGTGTTNYLPKFTGTTTIGNSQIFDNGTNVGIGTNSPNNPEGFQRVLNIIGGDAALVLSNTNGTAKNWSLGAYDGGFFRIADATTNRFLISSGGNVLIGNASDAGFKLDVNGTGRFSGNVGIGVAPSSRLHVKGSGTDGLILERSAASQDVFIKFQNENGVDVWQQLVTGTAQDFSLTRLGGSGNILLGSTGGNVGIGTNSPEAISSTVSSITLNGTSTSLSGGIVYQVNGNTKAYHYIDSDGLFIHQAVSGVGQKFFTNNVERMRITSGGNVGIGTDSPANPEGFQRILNISSNNAALVLSNTNGTTKNWSLGAYEDGSYRVVDGNSERMRINSGGNVLIGTGSANSKLQVAGSFATPHTTKSANYTLDATDYTVGFDCASNRTANLPDATTCAGRIYVIYQYNTNTGTRYVTIDPNGSQTINGLTTVNFQSYGDFSSLMIQSTGSNWVIISDALYFIPL
jgi:hypothetical protein